MGVNACVAAAGRGASRPTLARWAKEPDWRYRLGEWIVCSTPAALQRPFGEVLQELENTCSMPLTRRELLHLMSALGLLGACRPAPAIDTPESPDPCALPPIPGDTAPDLEVFKHGVASGDPLTDRVILWTRIEPSSPEPTHTEHLEHVEHVEWIVGLDPQFNTVIARGSASTSAEHDYTIKVDVAGLQPGTTYYYRFGRPHYLPCANQPELSAGPLPPPPPYSASIIGRTRTLPEHTEHLRIAYCSCANYPYGFFNVYRAIARREDLDVVLHLGDYIYEYADGRYGDGETLGRPPEPSGEIVTLADYRARHATYKRDLDLQAVHAMHPFITIWDDHESANDASVSGAQNHDPETQGDWLARKAAAIRAYFEWLPIRPSEPGRIHRSFRFGDLADLIMLDTRLFGRDPQVTNDDDQQAREDPSRSLLGADQEQWLAEQLRGSKRDGVAWRLLGQQVVFGQYTFTQDTPRSHDAWDGYPAARQRIFDQLRDEAISDVAVLSGDRHSSWALELCEDPWSTDAALSSPRAVEFVTPAVSSPGPVPAEQADEIAAQMPARHPHLRFVELATRGYVVLDIRPERLEAQWWHVERVDEISDVERFAKGFVVERGDARLREVTEPSA